MKDSPGGLHEIAQILSKNGVNVEDAYGFIIKSKEEAIFLFQVDNTKKVEKILNAAGHKTLSEEELYFL